MKIVIYGHFGHLNIGDELFKEAFKKLLPSHELIFTDAITNTTTGDALIFGGGSFLETPINAEHYPDGTKAPTFNEPIFNGSLQDTSIYYVGVGAETAIHPDHQILLRNARLIATRNNPNDAIKYSTSDALLKDLAYKTIQIPDLVYYLDEAKPQNFVPKRVLLLPNINVVPKYTDAHWKHASWDHFKLEYAQFLDQLIVDGYAVDYLPMSTHFEQLDDNAITEVRNLMKHGHKIRGLFHTGTGGIHPLIALFSSYETIITQRFHGAIISEMARRPYMCISHHDKLKSTSINEGTFISYYSTSWRDMLKSFHQTIDKKLGPKLPLDQHLFEEIKLTLNNLLENQCRNTPGSQTTQSG